jgi:GT2 family glycosyltransferase
MADIPRVAVIVLNWNGFDDTVACLESIRLSDHGAYQVVLVDNGSSSDQAGRLAALFPEVHLVRNVINRGFAGGNNDGINWALTNGFDYIVNLNNDCVVEKDWLSHLVAGVSSAGGDFGCSRIMFDPDRDIICSDADALCPDGSVIAEKRGERYCGSATRRITSACGAASIYSARCLREVALKDGREVFDELYFAYYEDGDLGLRLAARGFKGVSVPDAVVYHKHSRTLGDLSKLKIFHSEKNRILNEIFNFPLYLVPLGEMFFAAKLVGSAFWGMRTRQSRAAGYLRGVGPWEMFLLLLRARFWLARNLPAILADRQERKRRGLIKRSVLSTFCWDLSKIIR